MIKLYHCKDCNFAFKASEKKPCPFCKTHKNTDGNVQEITHDMPNLPDAVMLTVWMLFEQESVLDENNQLKETFFGFPAGTSRTDIWRWFENNYPGGVMHLMSDLQKANSHVGERLERTVKELSAKYGPEYNHTGSLMINAGYVNNLYFVNQIGDYNILDQLLALILAVTYEKVEKEATPKLSAEQFFKLVADTATLIYKTKHDENMRE